MSSSYIRNIFKTFRIWAQDSKTLDYNFIFVWIQRDHVHESMRSAPPIQQQQNPPFVIREFFLCEGKFILNEWKKSWIYPFKFDRRRTFFCVIHNSRSVLSDKRITSNEITSNAGLLRMDLLRLESKSN